ncbi:MAG: hypothetical protein R3B13_07015 [Polyangiaceae bacterium]
MNITEPRRIPRAIMTPSRWAAVALVLSHATALHASETKFVRLKYELIGAEQCPDRDELAGAVEAELGYAPFRDDAKETLVVRISERAQSLEAKVQLQDESGKVLGERLLSSAAGDCGELARTLALAVAIAIDPVRANQPKAPEPTPEPEPATAPKTLETPPRTEKPIPLAAPMQPVEPFKARIGAGGLVALGVAPAVAPGVWVAGGIGKRAYSLDLEGRATFAVDHQVSNGTVSASLLAVSLVPCLRFDWLHACPTGTVGALQGSGQNVDRPKKATTLYAAAGARAGIEVPSKGPFSFVLDASLDANLTRTTLRIDGREAWSSPSLAAAVSAGARGHF